MESNFYELIEQIEATHSTVTLGVLLAAARAHFDGPRLSYLERLVARRMAAEAREGGTRRPQDGGSSAAA